MCHKLCSVARSSGVHRTESGSVLGHEWSAAVSSTGSDQRQRSFFCPYLVVLERGLGLK